MNFWRVGNVHRKHCEAQRCTERALSHADKSAKRGEAHTNMFKMFLPEHVWSMMLCALVVVATTDDRHSQRDSSFPFLIQTQC